MKPNYPEIDLHGLFADEARARLEQAITNAIDAGHDRIRIVHGKGSGILRREVRDLLKYHPSVRTYQHASAHDGGEGVTIAALAAP
jgi:DNA mismatch repair protein MutS2